MTSLNDHIEQRMTIRQIPGLAVRIYRAHNQVFEREWGYADVNKKIPVTNTTLFRIGCLTKPVIALTILALAEDGFIGLDDPIVKCLPQLANGKKPHFAEITIAHLLAHRSGIARGTYYEESPDMEKILVEISKSDVVFEPGTAYKYSNWGYLLLGELLQNVTGMAAAEYAGNRILRPLQMNHTFFQAEDMTHDGMAKGYWDNWHFGFPDLSQPLIESKWFPIAPSASGLVSTPDDFGKLIMALTQTGVNESPGVLPPNIFKYVFTKIAEKSAHKFTSLCLYCEEIAKRDVWYFPGTNSGFSAYFFFIPSLGISGVAMANRTACNNELRELLELIISHTWPDMPASCLSKQPAPFEGEFTNHTGEILRLKINSETGNHIVSGNKTIPLLFCSPRNYFQLGGDYRQHMLRLHSKKGEIFEVSSGARSYRPGADKKTNKDTKAAFLAGFTGVFEYPAFGRVEVLLRGHKLYLNFGVIYETILSQTDRNTFRQSRGPFIGECIRFASTETPGQRSPYFLLNGMKFKRFDKNSIL